MNYENRVSSNPAPRNQTNIPKKAGSYAGHVNNYGGAVPSKHLSTNQIIKGEITDLHNNEVTILLDDNTTVTGQLTNGSGLSIGHTAVFKVSSLYPNVVLDTMPISETLIENSTIVRALDAAGLPKTDYNQMIVRELMANKMPINKQSIQTILQQAYRFSDTSISTLIVMNKQGIPVTEANTRQFENYRSMNHQLIKEVNSLSESVPALLGTLAEKSPVDSVIPFGKQLFSIVLSNENTMNDLSPPDLTGISIENRSELVEILETFSLLPEQKEAILNGSISLRDVIHLINDSMSQAHSFDERNMDTLREEQLLSFETQGIEPDLAAITSELASIPKTMEVFNNPVIDTLFSFFDDLQYQNNEIASVLTPEGRMELLSLLKDFPLSPSVKQGIDSGELTLQAFIGQIKDNLFTTPKESVISLFQSDLFQTIFKEQILSNWTITPKTLQKEKSTEELYERMHQQVSKMETFLNNTLGSTEIGSSLSNQAGNMRENMDFMQNLNQFFPYIQLPLKFQGQTVHSDLYVYTKKKNLQSDSNNISILLHLDMEQLGPLDIHLTLQHTSVTSKFYFAGKDIKKLFVSHIDELSYMLEEKGYSFSSELLIREKEVDIVKDFIEENQSQASLKRYTFDIRA